MGIEGAGKPPSTHHRQLPQVVEEEEGEVEVDREEEAEVEGAVVAQNVKQRGCKRLEGVQPTLKYCGRVVGVARGLGGGFSASSAACIC